MSRKPSEGVGSRSRRATEDALVERLRFETLLAEVSSRFINVPAAEVDGQIEEALGLIGEFLGLDRGTIVVALKDERRLRVTHSWAAAGLEPIPTPMDISVKGLPWGSDRVFGGDMIMFSRIEELPDGAKADRITLSLPDGRSQESVTVKQAFLRLGTRSHLTVPLSVGGTILGVLCFATLRSEHLWGKDIVQRLRFIAETFANALARKRSEEELAEYRCYLEQMVLERTSDLVDANTQLRQEIEQHELTQRALRESEERFRSIAAATPLPLVIVRKSDMSVLYANTCFFDDLGAAPEGIPGRDVLSFLPESFDREGLLCAVGERAGRFETRFSRPDGTPGFMIASAQSMVFGADEAFLLCLYDITQRRQAEEMLQQLYQQEVDLRQRTEAELQRRVEFTRMVAHELKTPLTPVLASSESLVAELRDKHLLSLARNVHKGAMSLNDRIDELLDLARGEMGMLVLNSEPVDVLQLLREAIETMAPMAGNKGLSLGLSLPSTLPTVNADVLRLQQVVLNLLTNAVKFTPSGGTVELAACEEDGSVIVEVKDTGPGISKKEEQRIFRAYERVSDDSGNLPGMGLGLALCKTIIDFHGGRIWAKRRAAGGSTFGFSLPVGTPAGSAEAPSRPALWNALIIEDDAEIVESVSLILKRSCPEAGLLVAASGEEGLDLVEHSGPDVVILDLNLPDISGFEVLRRLRLFSAVPIVVLTVREGEDDIAKALDRGADDYITKPFRTKELLARLRAQLRKRSSSGEGAPLTCGILRYDPASCQLRYGDRDISLTVVEGRIMQHLMKHAGQVVTHSRLAEVVWGEDYEGATAGLRSHIRRLRKKLEVHPGGSRTILTRAGIGYMLAKPM